MAKVWVKGYTKDDGTKVSGYWRDTTIGGGKKVVAKKTNVVAKKSSAVANGGIECFDFYK